MIIIDSSLWVEYFLENDIDKAIVDAIKNTRSRCVPSICLYEVHKKFLSMGNAGKADLAVDIMQNATVVNVTSQIAIQAARLGRELKLPMADSIIYATAQIYNADIYTQDSHFEGLDGVYCFAKP